MSWDRVVALLLVLPLSIATWTWVRTLRLREFTDPARVDALTERERRGLRYNAETLAGAALLLGPLGRPAARTSRAILGVLGDRGRPAPSRRQARWGPTVFIVGGIALVALLVALLGSGAWRTGALWTLYVSVPLTIALGAWVHLRNVGEQ